MTYIIAEAGVNHNGSVDNAMEMVRVAASAGADAVKFQTFNTDLLVTEFAQKADYQIDHANPSESQYEMLKKLELNENAHLRLQKYCNQLNIDFLSTPFELESVDLLVKKCQLKRLKISSGDLTNAPLLLEIARRNCDVILSTGMATLNDIFIALSVLAFGYAHTTHNPSRNAFLNAFENKENRRLLSRKVAILQCTSAYPTEFYDVNLRVMDTLRKEFHCQVGLSDHTLGYHVAIAAAARGADIIEKHFTLDKNLPGPDHKASLNPDELALMIRQIRDVEQALGSDCKVPSFDELKNSKTSRKSLVIEDAIKAGQVFRAENITVKRPGIGVSPVHYWDYLGRTSDIDYKKGELIQSWNL